MRFKALLTALMIVAVTAVATGCGENSGGDNAMNGMDHGGGASGEQLDAMFVKGMIPHHQSAIDMANLALESSERPQIKQLSEDIISSQQAEIDQMEQLKKDLPATQSSMMSQSMMDEMMGDVEDLKGAKPFDKAFIDAMIPHHQAAVVMAKRVKADGSNPQVNKLVTAIIAAQTREIEQMQRWREAWYGSRPPTDKVGSMHSGH